MWIVPKTDWQGEQTNADDYFSYEGDYFSGIDFQRITENIKEIYSIMVSKRMEQAVPVFPTKSELDLFYASEFNNILTLLSDAAAKVGIEWTPLAVKPKSRFFNAEELNNIEGVISEVHTKLIEAR